MNERAMSSASSRARASDSACSFTWLLTRTFSACHVHGFQFDAPAQHGEMAMAADIGSGLYRRFAREVTRRDVAQRPRPALDVVVPGGVDLFRRHFAGAKAADARQQVRARCLADEFRPPARQR